jgi:hypothetical protein
MPKRHWVKHARENGYARIDRFFAIAHRLPPDLCPIANSIKFMASLRFTLADHSR